MNLGEVIEKLNLTRVTGYQDKDRTISGAYTSDLLSDVIANSMKDNIWVTLQTHLNIVAVAKLKELSAILIVMNKPVEEETIAKAESENVSILATDMNAFSVSGKLYEMGIR